MIRISSGAREVFPLWTSQFMVVIQVIKATVGELSGKWAKKE